MPMRQEVIQNFLDVPGIAGVALIDGISRPFFHGFATGFDFSQQEGVAQSIQQVLETAPEGFNSFEFQFGRYRVYLHKLNQGTTLLVLTGNYLPRFVYMQEIRRLLLELQIGQENPIAEFRSLAAHIPISFKPLPLPSQPIPVLSEDLLAEHQPNQAVQINPAVTDQAGIEAADLALAPETATAPSLETKPSEPKSLLSLSTETAQIASTEPIAPQPISVKEVLAAINTLSQITAQYLGTMVVANYWKVTCPDDDWLHHFQIERSGQMTYVVQIPSERLPLLTVEQHQTIQIWVAAFLERCSKVIRNFAKIVQHSLDDRQKSLLLHLPH